MIALRLIVLPFAGWSNGPALIETKIAADDDGLIEGIAWKYAEADRIGDVITKGAFSKAAMPLPMLFGHNQNDPVGAWEAGEEREKPPLASNLRPGEVHCSICRKLRKGGHNETYR